MPARLLQIGQRAGRAGVTIIRTQTDMPNGAFDIVFVDAPCSGSGTWRRQPEQKWRLTSARLVELAALQDQLLDTGAARVRPGGRLIYATCSLLALENDDRIDAFRARHPEFTLRRADEAWDGADMPGMGEFFRATPATTGTDGFFAAVLVRKDKACELGLVINRRISRIPCHAAKLPRCQSNASPPPCGEVEIAKRFRVGVLPRARRPTRKISYADSFAGKLRTTCPREGAVETCKFRQLRHDDDTKGEFRL